MWEGVGWGWALINFAAFRMGAYSRLALIRGWALIRRNAVFNLSVEHFWRSLLISRNGFGSTNFFTAFRLRNFFFSCFFLLFFLCHSLLYFLDLFFDSLPSLTHLSPPPPCPFCSRQEGTTILFWSRPLPRLFRLLGLRKKYGLLCGLKDFALIDVLVSWKL